MIRLDVENYCNSCMDFVPDVIKPNRLFNPDTFEWYLGDTVVQCEHRKRCANIKRYLEQQAKNESK